MSCRRRSLFMMDELLVEEASRRRREKIRQPRSRNCPAHEIRRLSRPNFTQRTRVRERDWHRVRQKALDYRRCRATIKLHPAGPKLGAPSVGSENPDCIYTQAGVFLMAAACSAARPVCNRSFLRLVPTRPTSWQSLFGVQIELAKVGLRMRFAAFA
jgi:hypothetical protein